MYDVHISVKPEYASGYISPCPTFPHNADMDRPRGKTYLREWRNYPVKRSQGKVVAALAEVGYSISQGHLSRIEKGEIAYNQDLLEALAEIYKCTVSDLTSRHPESPEAAAINLFKEMPERRHRAAIRVLEAFVEDDEERAKSSD